MSDDLETTDLRELRRQAELAKEKQKENDELRRQLLFSQAGVDTESKLGSMLYRTWEGTDLAALKAEAAELGLTGTGTPEPTPDPTPTVSDDERYHQQVRQQIQSGQAGHSDPAANTANPWDEGYQEFHAALGRGTPREVAGLELMQRVVGAGMNGDKRVHFDSEAHAAEAARLERLTGIR